jgi:ADP-heptose:LPS heptosyltransferase
MGSGEAFPANMVVQLLKQKFTNDHITVVAGDRTNTLLSLLQDSTVIRVPLAALTTFYLPRKEILARITQRPYDLAIDLNLDLVLPSGYICRKSTARVRVGFVSKRSDIFYNFQIHPDPTLNRQLIYDRLAKCLQMF